MTYTLRIESPFINPAWFNRVRDEVFVLETNGNGAIDLAGQTLTSISTQHPLQPNTTMRVWLDGDFQCEPFEEYQERMVSRRIRMEEKKQKEHQRVDERKKEAEQVNGRIMIPAAWQVAIKDVLSGLSPHGMSNGYNKRTVHHVMLLEDLSVGRIKRRSGDLLCTAKSGSNGNNYIGREEPLMFLDYNCNRYTPAVTCKSCLKLAAKVILPG